MMEDDDEDGSGTKNQGITNVKNKQTIHFFLNSSRNMLEVLGKPSIKKKLYGGGGEVYKNQQFPGRWVSVL